MEPAMVLPLVAFVAVAAIIVMLLRRAGRLLATTRDVERFRRQVADLTARVDASLSQVADRIDALRRSQLSADAIVDDLTASLDTLNRYTDEARALRPPSHGRTIHEGIVEELERAHRALQMVEHGCSIQMNARAGSRELESQTAIKRGYLNVLHAREAITRHGVEAAALAQSDAAGHTARRIV